MTGTHIEYLFEFCYAMSNEDLQIELALENLETSGTRAQLLGRLRRHYRTALVEIRKRRKGSWKTEDFYNYFIVIDFECSCEENNYDFEHEIIEFPACLVSVHSRKIIDQFRTIVRPVKKPKLTEFCQKLTGITQKMVDKAPTFPEALKKFRVWMAKHGLDGIGHSTGGNAKRFCYVTDGPWDIGKFLQMQCVHSGIKVPHDLRFFLNIRRSFVNFYFHLQGHREAAQKKLPTVDLKTMLGHLGIKFEGHEHCGLDDTRNIARILVRMLHDKAELRVNEKLVLGTKLRRWQKLIFNENAKAPSCQVTPSSSSEYSAQIEGENVDEFMENFGQKLRINSSSDENVTKEKTTNQQNEEGKIIVWKKWWNLMPYKLIKIGRVDFLGERHKECESCDDYDSSEEEDKDEQVGREEKN